MHEEWKGGNMALYPGGGHKLNLLRKEIELLKNETDLVVMFTDRYLNIFSKVKVKMDSFNVNKNKYQSVMQIIS